MDRKNTLILKTKLDKKSYQKLMQINNRKLHQFIEKYLKLCNPDKVFVCSNSLEDIQYIREEATKRGEEKKLAINGHTVHFDGYHDQARDKEHTKLLFSQNINLDPNLNAIDKRKGLDEIHTFLKNIMRGHKLYVCFFCLGPVDSEFSIPCVQLTDSSYVAHSENLLYRCGYERFKKLDSSEHFFRFVHSEGKLQKGVSLNIEKRRIYVDIEENIVYSTNTQYGGNTIGLKKLAMRLAINKASKEGWLTEHMFIMGVHGPNNRITYFAGAFPSACGKTSTSMLKKESIIGDDIAYLKKKMGKIRAVNPEKGIFGIIKDVNSKDDPIIWEVIHRPGEIIFSNVLITKNGDAYWIGKDGEVPTRGFNYSGEWVVGKKDSEGNEITPSHRNARFTLDLKLLKNLDSKANHPGGVTIGGIAYGGRDSDTSVPVEESFNWTHGIITKGASLESETTSATLGKEGVRKFNPMANLDFLSIPLDRYIKNNLDFGEKLEDPPSIFSVNYFLKDREGNFLNDKSDKAVWFKWMELRSHRDIGAIKMPTGFIPK
ncbi:phosphoenolpyruvate carboxykinase (GTP), partial [Patescibacteria group bacterium]|nr:phosphoenolpyruvate carboxykinase (GTP) [Patescibacteria group bacterium]